MDWKQKALAATVGSRFGAILRAALQLDNAGLPRFATGASITSDGFVMCDFTDRNGTQHMGAFVGSHSDLIDNCEGLAKHLKLSTRERLMLTTAISSWVATDYRSLHKVRSS